MGDCVTVFGLICNTGCLPVIQKKSFHIMQKVSKCYENDGILDDMALVEDVSLKHFLGISFPVFLLWKLPDSLSTITMTFLNDFASHFNNVCSRLYIFSSWFLYMLSKQFSSLKILSSTSSIKNHSHLLFLDSVLDSVTGTVDPQLSEHLCTKLLRKVFR